MNLYQQLNQNYRSFKEAEAKEKVKALKESETKVEETEIIEGQDPIDVKEIDERLKAIDDALKTAAPDEKEALEKEKAELTEKLNALDTKEADEPVVEPTQEVVESTEDCEDCTDTVATLSTILTDLETEDFDKEALTAKVQGLIDSLTPDEEEETVEEISEEPTEVEEIEDAEMVEEGTGCIDCTKALHYVKTSIDLLEPFESQIDFDNMGSLEGACHEVLEYLHTLEGLLTTTDIKDSEELTECEVKAFRVTRKSPKFNAYMIEAETKEGMVYITGKNFNEETKVLEEAEQTDNKGIAAERFKSLLK